ncbi:hypothetical protein CK203_029166 [Vitis vinifera]|uniref:Uncharacterized protein n=1 Tax=Vitis vinifera TaxID=29760 RepID=A0A438ISX4_VITVI|nr:hypothetical protein CK203_029166 [Vitis vinifera]
MVVEVVEEGFGDEGFFGFIWKFKGKTRTRLLEICFNSKGRFIKITEFVTNRKATTLFVPKGVKNKGWKTSSMSKFRFHPFNVSKEAKTKKQVGLGCCSGNRSYAKVVEEEGLRKGASVSVGKWARIMIYKSQRRVKDWVVVDKALA